MITQIIPALLLFASPTFASQSTAFGSNSANAKLAWGSVPPGAAPFDDLLTMNEFQDNQKNRDLQGTLLGLVRCDELMQTFEWRGYAEGQRCECATDPEDPNTVTLSCEADCQRCNAESSVCYAGGVFSQTYEAESGNPIAVTSAIPYNQGRNETVVFITNVVDEITCLVTIDGEICNSCERVECESGRVGTTFDCSNIATVSDTDNTPVGVINTCDTFEAQTGVMEFLNDDFQSGCEGSPPILNTCQQFDDTVLRGLNCRCSPFAAIDGSYLAECIAIPNSCDVEVEDCGILSVQAIFDPEFSSDEAAGTGFGYNNTIEFDRSTVHFFIPTADDAPVDCVAAANGELCNRCEVMMCDSGPQVVIDCANVFPDIAIKDRDPCDPNLYEGTPFGFVPQLTSNSTTNPPTSIPVSPPVDQPIAAPVMPPVSPPVEAPSSGSSSFKFGIALSLAVFLTIA